MKKTLPILALIIVILFMFFGNNDRKEISKKAYIAGIGIDKSDSGEDIYKYTFYIPKSSNQSSESSSKSTSSSGGDSKKEDLKGSGGATKISVEAKSIFSAMDLANNSFSNAVSLSHVKILLFSDKLSKKDIDKNIESTFHNTLLSHTSYVAITDKTAEEVFDNLDEETQSKQDSYFGFIKNSHESTGLTSVIRLVDYDVARDSHSGRAVLTYIGYGSEETRTK